MEGYLSEVMFKATGKSMLAVAKKHGNDCFTDDATVNEFELLGLDENTCPTERQFYRITKH